ncbi:MAG: hypothetical protein ABI851_01895 [Saprospiraceae bacterium]
MQNSLKIVLAYGVSDLTSARYLAAMEVDYLLLNLDDSSYEENLEFIKQLNDWIEGPILIGVAENSDKIEVYNSLNILFDTIPFGDLNSRKFKLNHPKFGDLQFSLNKNNKEKFFDEMIGLSVQPLDENQELTEIKAYLISIDKEEKKGIYNFEKLDLMFEAMDC